MARRVLTRVIALALMLLTGLSWLSGPVDEVWVGRQLHEALWIELDEVSSPDIRTAVDDPDYRNTISELSQACRAAIAGHFRADRWISMVGLVLASTMTILVFLPAKCPAGRAT